MMGRVVGGRGRSQSEYSPRVEDRERRSGWGVAPPSRSLWVGSLSAHVTQNTLSEQFLRFGELENISYTPGRSYAFVNYKKAEDAAIAMRGLQGSILAGMPIRIEFAKGDKASILPRGEENPHYTDATMERGDSLSRRDLRIQRPGPEKPYEKSKSDNSSEPCEMLWIGFPSYMNVDEMVLRRAFSPFGEIDKISAFPGRAFAFVRFKTILAACRAKEALQGKLFNSPRVSICFARSENLTEQGRGPASGPYNPLGRVDQGGGETFQRERSFESPLRGEFQIASPRFMSNMDQMPRDSSITSFGRNSSIRSSAVPEPNFGGTFEHGILHELGTKRRMLEDPYEHHRDSPAAPVSDKPAPWLDFSFERPQTRRAPPLEDPWGPENDSFAFVKRQKTDSFPDNELPEYPFSDFEQEKRKPAIPKSLPDLPDQPTYNKSIDPLSLGFNRASEPLRNIARPLQESNDSWRKFDASSAASGSSLQKFNSESQPPPLNKEWKWEGTIAKGGTAVCRARCFPVGKVMDFMLPETLDCTARTGLDMLAKHYYQAASTWVVFFVPETDADMGYYNEFMNYLGEKRRSAVAKLGDKVSLFLVPPSDFSEQVLKVPGKVSISGVILKFQQPSSGFSSLNNQKEVTKSKPPSIMPRPNDAISLYGDTSFPKQSSPDFRSFSHSQSSVGSSSGHAGARVPPSFQPPTHKAEGSLLPGDNLPVFHNENRHNEFPHPNPPFPSNWPNKAPVPNSSIGAFSQAPSVGPHIFDNAKIGEYAAANPKATQSKTLSNYPKAPAIAPLPAGKFPQQQQQQQQQQAEPQAASSMQLPLHPHQLAHIATLLEQQKQLVNPGTRSGENKQSYLPQSPSRQTQTSFPYAQTLPHASEAIAGPQVSQAQQLQPQVSSASTIRQPVENPAQQSSQQPSNSNLEETEADPQKRLQATLQLAAALLQQIQQRAKS